MVTLCLLAAAFGPSVRLEELPATWVHPQFQHLSTTTGELLAPNPGSQQTASLVADLDLDGVNDFVITERTLRPAVVWYRRHTRGWSRYVVEADPLPIEAGGAFHDITGNGAPDLVFGGDYRSNEVWWWENPYPDYAPDRPWRRHVIKASGARKHHDQLFGDFDGDGRPELVFWNQGARRLIRAVVPDDPLNWANEWKMHAVYSYTEQGERQRGSYPTWRQPHEHEGLAAADVDGDGLVDILGGGRWFKYEGVGVFTPHPIDSAYVFTRVAVGRFKPGLRPQVVLAIGDGKGPLLFYEWQENAWVGKPLLDDLWDAHSLAAVDFDGNGCLDIFVGEMQLGRNPNPRAWILFGDGEGGFDATEILNGFGLHEARAADLDGDGRIDILAKPYTWQAPRLDVFINRGTAGRE